MDVIRELIMDGNRWYVMTFSTELMRPLSCWKMFNISSSCTINIQGYKTKDCIYVGYRATQNCVKIIDCSCYVLGENTKN